MHWGRMNGKRRQYFVLIMKDFYFFIVSWLFKPRETGSFWLISCKSFSSVFYIVNSTVSIDSTIFFIDPVMNWKFCPYFFQQFQIDCTGFTLLWLLISLQRRKLASVLTNQLQNHFDNQSHLAYSRFLAFYYCVHAFTFSFPNNNLCFFYWPLWFLRFWFCDTLLQSVLLGL